MVEFADIEAAARRIAPGILRTPLLHSAVLDEAAGARVFVKAECLQRFGAFKMRGAYNRLAAMTDAQRAGGVIAFSSGNHGIAVTGAARDFGAKAAIVAPSDAPAIKLDTIKALGGEVIRYDRLREDREAVGAKLAAERGATLVKPFDDPFVIAGQGTIGLEIAEEIAPDFVLAPASGGGLASGIAVALAQLAPTARVVAVEPEGHDDIARSLADGTRRENEPGVRSICDALLVPTPGDLTFPLLRANDVRAASVSDAEALGAMAFAFQHLKIVLEPSGAVALAAVLARKAHPAGSTIVVVASGGNVDAQTFARALAQ